MAGASTGIYEFDSIVRGHHIYKLYGLHALMKQCSCKKTPTNTMNSYAVTISKVGCIVEQCTKFENILILKLTTLAHMHSTYINRLQHVFYSFCCMYSYSYCARHIIEPMLVTSYMSTVLIQINMLVMYMQHHLIFLKFVAPNLTLH